jgi:hypothetical protein
MSIDIASQVPFRPAQCTNCQHLVVFQGSEPKQGRCRAYQTPSAFRPILATFRGEDNGYCPKYEAKH